LFSSIRGKSRFKSPLGACGSIVTAAILLVLDVIPDLISRHITRRATYRSDGTGSAYRCANQCAGSGADGSAANCTFLTCGERFSGAGRESK
jgi:hypothetical protein